MTKREVSEKELPHARILWRLLKGKIEQSGGQVMEIEKRKFLVVQGEKEKIITLNFDPS